MPCYEKHGFQVTREIHLPGRSHRLGGAQETRQLIGSRTTTGIGRSVLVWYSS